MVNKLAMNKENLIDMQNKTSDLPKWLWLWVPVVIALLPYVARIINRASDDIIFGELGIIENVTVIFLVIAIVLAIKSFKLMHDFSFPFFRFWMVLLAVGCFYYAGEELSWGQHWIGWETPEVWQGVNDQGETNLHNTSPILDQLPRTLLTIAAVVGGILAPLFFMRRGRQLERDEFNYWLWPTYVNIPCCLLSVLVSMHEKAYKWFGTTVPDILDIRAGETKECLLAIFLFMYIASFYPVTLNELIILILFFFNQR